MGEDKKCPCDAMTQAQKEIKGHTERLSDGDTKFAVMELQLATIVNDTKEIKADLRELKEKPGRKWEGITEKITNWAAILLLAYVATQIGL